METELQTLRIEQQDERDFLVTIEDWELDYDGEPALFPIGQIGQLAELLRRVKERRRADGRDLILEKSELGDWMRKLPKRTKLIHTRTMRVSGTGHVQMWRIGFRLRFVDPRYATLFKLRYC
ncbi:hypothetical protein ACIGGE_10710 [Qipengyuania sp. NPDC077410]|uniref:hypothetical protein n=1 Tax=Qipengyuania sp. NPDC077410 TaxID=3364496 RepID=UPI0037C57193